MLTDPLAQLGVGPLQLATPKMGRVTTRGQTDDKRGSSLNSVLDSRCAIIPLSGTARVPSGPAPAPARDWGGESEEGHSWSVFEAAVLWRVARR